ncbi:MAG: hypothetical protein HN383_14955 [Verrucomicrobia bacterium]|nr:hypothetical protein [Verrucomicrobiota bacterium]
MTDGTWKPDSDLDVVWIHHGKRRRHWYENVDYDFDGPIELVLFDLKRVRDHFRQQSPMAHALQSCLVLYDPKGLHADWVKTPLGLPTCDWINDTYAFMLRRLEWGIGSYRQECGFHRRFCGASKKCHCAVTDVLCRAVWNLVRLIFVVQGHVPMSKVHGRQLFQDITRGVRLRRALDITLQVHHEKRYCRIEEAREMVYLGQWARSQLHKSLGDPRSASRGH